MRYYNYIDKYLDELEQDIYEQPPDEWHTRQATDVINKWIPLLKDCHSVLDVGCGQGFCLPIFTSLGISYYGITLGADYEEAPNQCWMIFEQDFSFIPWKDDTIDLIFSRHSLEHSPMPLLTLMEWHRVARKYLCLILPKPDYCGFKMPNHYSVLYLEQIEFLLDRAGWEIMWTDHDTTKEEYRFMCIKVPRINKLEIKNYAVEMNYDKVLT